MKEGRISLEDRRLLNPAFVGSIVIRAIHGHEKEASAGGLPFVYSFLIPPLVLHPETRERLPIAIVTKLIPWTERNSELLIPFGRRIAELAPATRDGVFLFATTNLIRLGAAARLTSVASARALTTYERTTGSTEVSDCLKKAYFVGRWLASAGTVATVLTALGVSL